MVFYLQIPLYQTIAIDSFSLLERKKIIGWALSRHNDLGKTKIGISSQDTIKLQCFLDPIQRRNDTLLSPKPKLRPGANQPRRSSPQAHDDDISIYNKYDLFRNKTRPFDRFRETLDVSYRYGSIVYEGNKHARVKCTHSKIESKLCINNRSKSPIQYMLIK